MVRAGAIALSFWLASALAAQAVMVTAVAPNAGPTSGGTSVTITGTDFLGATAVSFGGTPAASFTVNSDTQIFATAPAGAAGTVNIAVTTPGGTSTATAADQFTYVVQPSVTSVTPTMGPTGGGTTVVITGSGLLNATAVTFGGTPATGYTVISNTQITATAPAGTGTVDIRVTTVGGTSATSASDQYTYVVAPTVTSVSPTAGPTAGGTTVVITGTGFAYASPTGAVKFGAANATYTINSNTQITATAPANSAGTYDITVTTPGGTSATSSSDQYTYVAAPTVTAISPIAGPTAGGTTVVITGTGFTSTTAVTFGATAATGFTVNSNTQITATAPANLAGTYDVRVTTVGGTSAPTASDQYTYVAAPTVTSVSPTAGPTAGGTTVTITGTGFSAANPSGAVKFGATNATYTINSNTQITATAPANSAGTYDITVTTVGGTSSTSASDQYTYVAPPVSSSFTYGSIILYNEGSNASVSVDLSGHASNSPTSYAVGSATTAQGGSVSVDSSGLATYTPPVGYRNANDSFTFTATNLGGTSSPATVTLTIGNPTLSVSLPSATATVERAYNIGGAAVTVSGGRATYTINSISGLPSGLSDSGGGVVSGTPAVNGTFTVTVNVTDNSLGAGPYNANATATLTVVLPPAPTVSSLSVSALAYNTGSATASTFSLAAMATENPTGYQVGASSYGATVSIDSAGLVSYTPPVGFRGTDTFNYVATNAGGTSNVGQVFVTVNDPVFAVSLPAATGTVGEAYNSGGAAISLSGGNAPYSNFSASGLPAGLSMDSAGVISGTPTTAGNATVTITATDNSGGNGSFTGTASAVLSIAAPTIAIGPAALSNAGIGVPYGASLTSTGGLAPVTFAVTAGSLPPGLVLDPGGAISGIPTGGGTYNFTVTATDSATTSGPYTAAKAYALTVDPATIVLSPAAGALTGGTTGIAYSQTISASDGTGPYIFDVSTGALPAGLTLSPGGVLSGTPTASGTFNFTIRGTDSSTGQGPYSNSNAYSLTIGTPTIALAPAAGALPAATVGSAYNQTFTASNGTAPYSYAVTSGALPGGLTLSAAGDISGTPTASGTYGFAVTATDTYGAAGTETYSLAVGIQAPVAGAASATVSANSSANAIALALSGGAADSVTVATPASHGTATASGTSISYTPAAGYSGTDSFTYTATNVTGTSSAATVTITVSAPTLVFSPAAGALSEGVRGVAYSQTLAASGGMAPYAYAVTAGTLPAGLTLDAATGVLSGTPSAAGSSGFTVTATDLNGASSAAAYSLAIRTPAVTFTFTPAAGALPKAMAGEDYRQSITASGSTGPLLYRVAAGALPQGMVLNVSTGELTGPLDAASEGDYAFTIAVEDNNGATGSAAYSLTVAPRNVTVTDKVVDVPAGGTPADVYLNRGATGGPFISAETTFVEPPEAGTATVIRGQLAQAGPVSSPVGWYLQFTPNPAFSGTARVGFRLISALGTSNTGTVTYNLGFNAGAVAEDVDALVRGFVETRQSLIANGIHVPGLLERRQMEQANESVTARMTPSEDGMTARFSTSLAQMDAARDAADGIEGAAASPFNVWIDGSILAHQRDQNSGKWGSFAMLNFGADYLVSDKALVGLSFHLDRMTDPTDADAELTGNGWLAGPYASFQIGKGVYWDTSLLYGGSANDIDTALWDGSFDTTRWMVDTAIKGQWQIDEATVLTPQLRAVYFNETVDDYKIRNGAGDEIVIDGFDTEQFRVSLGAEIARSFTLQSGARVTPKVGVTVGYSGLDGSGAYGTLTAGVSMETADFWMLEASLLLNVEGDGQKSAGGKVRASKQF